jgi:uncharacterized membrane protein YfcA
MLLSSLNVFDIFLFGLIVVLSFFIKGITGFGNTLVLSPLLSFRLPSRIITPLDLLLGLPANVWMAYRERRHLQWRVVLPLSLMLLAGILPGVWLLKAADGRLLKALLGLAVAASAVEMALRKKAQAGNRQPRPVMMAIIGAVSGVLCGTFGIGAPLAAYISRATDGKGPFRANLCFVFLVENLFRLGIYFITGVLTVEAVKLAFLLLPAAALGLAVGMKVDLGLKPETTKKAIAFLMAAGGLSLLVTNLLLLWPARN